MRDTTYGPRRSLLLLRGNHSRFNRWAVLDCGHRALVKYDREHGDLVRCKGCRDGRPPDEDAAEIRLLIE